MTAIKPIIQVFHVTPLMEKYRTARGLKKARKVRLISSSAPSSTSRKKKDPRVRELGTLNNSSLAAPCHIPGQCWQAPFPAPETHFLKVFSKLFRRIFILHRIGISICNRWRDFTPEKPAKASEQIWLNWVRSLKERIAQQGLCRGGFFQYSYNSTRVPGYLWFKFWM